MPLTNSKRALAASICEFLRTSLVDGTLDDLTDKTQLENSIQSIEDAFNSDSAPSSSVGLAQIYSVFEKTQAKSANASSTDADFRPKVATPASSATKEPSADALAKAEQFKTQGNQAMSKKNYELAINHYTSALELNPDAKVYLSNRAAAYSSSGNHDAAIKDASRATEIDPSYGKAWSRLGHAYFGKGDLANAKSAYESGSKVDPTSEIMKRGLETSTKKLEEQGGAASRSPAAGGMPDLSALAGMFGNGGGGMPDMSAITSNPAFMSMAQNLMSSGALDGLLQNPRMAEMAQRFQSGDVPSMNEIMGDPELRNVAENFGRNFGGSGANNSSGASEDP